MPAITDLDQLLSSMEPVLRDGEFVVASTDASVARSLDTAATIVETEGTTVVLRRELADAAGLDYSFVARWITLTVHSSLEAVGLTAAFSAALGSAGISCNVLAGFLHDHILVPTADAERAMQVLWDLAATSAAGSRGEPSQAHP